jgi:hypothetical protein
LFDACRRHASRALSDPRRVNGEQGGKFDKLAAVHEK